MIHPAPMELCIATTLSPSHSHPQTYHYKQRHRHTCWSAFAAMNKGGGLFPELGVLGSGSLLSCPSKAYMETYCSMAFKRVSRR